VSLAAGEFEALRDGVEAGAFCGDAVALGISNRPRRCDAVGEADADELSAEVADAVALGASVPAGRAVREGSGVAVKTADGAAGAVLDVDVAVEVSLL